MTSRHPAFPPSVSLPWIAVAVGVWLMAWGYVSVTTPEPLAPGPIAGEAVLITDPIETRYGYRAVADWDQGNLLLSMRERPPGVLRGATVEFEGTITGEPGDFASHRYRARVSLSSLEVGDASPAPHIALGQSVRDRVMDRLRPVSNGRGLVAGFLIGDTTGLDGADLEAMRLAGLSHFVAVSGSNVALFLGLIFLVGGPLTSGPRRRAILGLAGLPVYAAATRFEPSVMRATVMAGLTLGGRLVGIVFEAWQLISLAVILLLLSQPALVSSAGFQLSVAATGGVLVGSRWPVRGKVSRALAVTIGAQLAVAPLILAHFGSVPMMSPLVNLMAAPLVAASTVLGAIGVAGPGLLIEIAARLADLVLILARGAERWPQVGLVGLVALIFSGAVLILRPRLRALVAVVVSTLVVATVVGPGKPLSPASVVVLDVGQGDAILIHGGDGRFALVDGGPDTTQLLRLLHGYGVNHLELVVLSHVHADHATGLTALPGRVTVDRLWARPTPHQTPASLGLFEIVDRYGIPREEPAVGDTYALGDLLLQVMAPLRRYASPNDQSIVIDVRGPARDMLLTGDIEMVAQEELGDLHAEVLKVPHQGAATSDEGWLAGVGAGLAVISVGANNFGHPSQRVIGVLERSGAEVLRTDEVGDVVVPLG